MPETVGALVAFLLFITPGLAFELMRERRRPAREYTAFRETAVIVVSSVAFSTTAAGALLVLRLWQREWFPDPVELFNEPSSYIRIHTLLALRSLVILVLLATGLGYIWHRLLRCAGPDGEMSPYSAWWDVTNGGGNRDRFRVVASLVLTDGTVLTGYLRGYDLDKSQGLRDLVLQTDPDRPIHVRHPNGSADSVCAEHWTFMVVPVESVFRTTLSLDPGGAPTDPKSTPKSTTEEAGRE